MRIGVMMKNTSVSRLLLRSIICFSVLMVLVSVLALALFSNRKEVEINTMQQTNLLHSSVQLFDSIVLQNHELLLQITNSPTIRYYIYATGADVSGTKKSDVMIQLAVAKSLHAHLDQVWLYDKRSELILDNVYNEEPLSTSIYGEITRAYLEQEVESTRILYNNLYANLFWTDTAFYIAREFPSPGEHSLGILFIEFDLDMIFNTMKLDSLEENRQIMFDEEQNFVQPLSTAEERETQIFSQMLEEGAGSKVVGSTNYVMVQSELTGWKYGRAFPVSRVFSLGEILPLLVLLVVIGLLAAILFSNVVYKIAIKPLQQLSQQARSHIEEADPNEISTISKFISKHEQSVITYNSTMENISAYVAENFFYDLCDGRPMSLDYIKTVLKMLGSPIDLQGIYWVVFLNPRKVPSLEHIIRLIKRSISGLDLDLDFLKCHIQTMPGTYILLLMEFPLRLKPEEAETYRRFIFGKLSEALWSLGSELDIGNGNLVYFLPDISQSFSQAVANSIPIHPAAREETDPARTAPDTSYDSIRNRFSAFANRLFDLVDNNRLWQVEKDLDQQIEANAQVAESQTQFRRLCSALKQQVLEKAMRSGIHPSDLFDSSSEDFDSREYVSEEEVRGNTVAVCMACLTAYSDKRRRHGHQLILSAKQYIDDHYRDPGLALNTIAEAVKTNPSYLSKLFVSHLGISFVEYTSKKRVEYAKELLQSTDLSVKEISRQSGFYSEQNFFRVFKKLTGYTPKQFRLSEKQTHA